MNWFKTHHGFISDPKFGLAAKDAQETRAVVIAIAIALLNHASENEQRGSIVGFKADECGYLLDIESSRVTHVTNALRHRKFISETNVMQWERYQERDVTAAARAKRYRDRLKNKENPPEEDDSHASSRVMSRDVTPDKRREEKKDIVDTTVSPLLDDAKRKIGKRLLAELSVDDVKATSVQIPAEYALVATQMSMPDSLTLSCWQEFVDYWRAVPGQKGVKLDWLATWRNSIRRMHGGLNEQPNTNLSRTRSAGRHPVASQASFKTRDERDPAARAYDEGERIKSERRAAREAAERESGCTGPTDRPALADLRQPADLRGQSNDDGLSRQDVSNDTRELSFF